VPDRLVRRARHGSQQGDLASDKSAVGQRGQGRRKKTRQSHELPESERRCEDGDLRFRAVVRERTPEKRRVVMETIKTVLFLLVAAALASAGMLAVVGGADGEYEHEGVFRITHPYPSTFDVMAEPKKRMYWVPGITSCEKQGAGELDVGSSFREIVMIDGERTQRVFAVKAYTQSKRLTLATTDELCDYEVMYNFGSHQTGRKTRLTYTLRAKYHHWFNKLIEPIRGAALKQRVRAELEALKTVLETTNEFR